jgi:hypothetical protein
MEEELRDRIRKYTAGEGYGYDQSNALCDLIHEALVGKGY